MEDNNNPGIADDSNNPVNPAGAEPKNSGSKVKKLIIKIAIIIVVLAVAIFAFAFFFTRGTVQKADEFVNNILDGKCDQIYALTSTEFREITSEQELNDACNRIGPVLTGELKQTGVNTEASTETGSTGTATYEIQGTDGLYEITVELVKEDGEWKVYSFLSSLKQ